AHAVLRRADLVVAEERAIHDRDPPTAPLAQPLADLMAVAEIAQRAAELQRRALAQAGEAGGAGAGQHALADAVAQLLLHGLRGHAEDEQGEAGTAVGRLVGL